MQKICPDNCEHSGLYPFMHIIVTTEATKKTPARSFLICAVCRHDVDSEHPRCVCHVSCHTLAREGDFWAPKTVASLTAIT